MIGAEAGHLRQVADGEGAAEIGLCEVDHPTEDGGRKTAPGEEGARAAFREAGGEIGEQRLARMADGQAIRRFLRSEEHTSELQSLMRISYAVFCLKKKK